MAPHRPQVLIGSVVMAVMTVCVGGALIWWPPVRTSPTFEPVHQISFDAAGVACIIPGVLMFLIFTRRGPWLLGMTGALVGSLVWAFLTVSIFISAVTRTQPPPAALPVAFMSAGYTALWISTAVATWYEHTTLRQRINEASAP